MFNNHIPDKSGNNKPHKVAEALAEAKSYILAHKKGTAAVGIAILLGLSGIDIACASGAFDGEQAEPAAQEVIEKELETAHIDIKADKGWTKDSTPAIVHIKSADGDEEKDADKVDFYHAVAPSEDNIGSYEVELEVGSYEVKVISPVNSDGSAYELFETEDAKTLEVKDIDGEDGNAIDMEMKLIPADKVTDEMLTAIVKDTKDAIAKGDESLKGDNGKAVLEVLDKNIEANPNAEGAKDESDKAKDDAEVDEAPVETPADQPADKPSADKPANNGNGGNASSNGGDSGSSNHSGNSSASKPSAPSHTHSWKDHTATKQVWVSNIVPVYENQQVQVGTKKVSDGWYWHCNCGAVVPASQGDNHGFNHIANDEPDNGYEKEHFHEEPVYETKRVQVGTRDDGHYETQTYVDYKYCDCGATK
ncbi:MAG: hypothetical protein Q4B30_00400 [Coriobacteriaceae bacterium]|nr:hypothetical protein [Coriobacteriaceae bacterium]